VLKSRGTDWISKNASEFQISLTLTRGHLFLISSCILILLLLCKVFVSPSYGTVAYQYDNQEQKFGENPIFVNTESQYMTITVPVYLSVLHPTRFFIKPDDCLEQMEINGDLVQDSQIPYCDHTTLGKSLDLSSYVRAGANVFQFRVKDDGGLGGIRITAARFDTLLFFLNAVIVLFASLLVYIALTLRTSTNLQQKLAAIFVGGFALRAMYFLATHHFVRAHDVTDHIKYILHLAEYWSIPPASDGFVFHHPPLYYIIAAVWRQLWFLFGVTGELLDWYIQFLSFLFSLGTMGVAIWLAMLLFPKKEHSVPVLLFSGIIATFPSLIFLSARITNNTLYVLLSFIAIALLLRWWEQRSLRRWLLLIAIIALAFITRVSALLFAGVAFACLAIAQNVSWKQKWRYGVAGIGLFLLMTGWLPLVRFYMEDDPTNTLTLGNQTMHSGLLLETNITNMLTFNPFGFLQQPFNHAWEDYARRQYFWEYWFRSAFFGEFQFPDEFFGIGVFLLLTATLCIPFGIYGFWKAWTHKHILRWPLSLLTIAMIAAHLWYRLFAPYSANQDFRHSIPILIPILFFCIHGIDQTSPQIRRAGQMIAIAFIFLEAAFIGFLYFYEI